MRDTLFPLLLVSTFLFSCGFKLAEPHSLKYDHTAFNDLASFILEQQEIYEMDDFTRHYKSINGTFVKLESGEGDQNAQFLSIVEDSLKLDPKIVSALRVKLEETKLREFTMSGDSILFVVDGFLDNSWGFMYVKSGIKMDSADFIFKDKSVKFVEDINPNWKRAAIR